MLLLIHSRSAHEKLGLGQTWVSSCQTLGLRLLELKEPSRVRVRKDFSFFMMILGLTSFWSKEPSKVRVRYQVRIDFAISSFPGHRKVGG